MPHMRLHYEAEVINYWKSLIEYDEQITETKKAIAQPRDATISTVADMANGGDVSIIYILLPIFAVIFTVLLVRCLVYWRIAEDRSIGDRNEKMPLIS
ncbi:unnamed protein product [Strongylus vulgaris]|uniref:Uncharacterized protein n=1 Tax=Strongylus vulgaris TaxID=40348 RepID=A0A3P7IAD9_STRVU|nr:unnamed protein product [Strongylus vulgaris]